MIKLKQIAQYRFIIYGLLLLPFLFFSINIYDEGIILVNAQRILDGQIPHKDFWTIYPLGQYLVYAVYIKIFGHNLFLLRLCEVVFGFIFIHYIYKTIKLFTHNTVFSGCYSVFILLCILRPELRFFPAIYSTMLMTLLISFHLSKYLFFKDIVNFRLLFLFQFLILFFRQDVFLYSLVSLIISLLILSFAKLIAIKELIKSLFLFMICIVLIFFVLFWVDLWPVMIKQLFIEPFYIISKYRALTIDARCWTYFTFSLLFLAWNIYQVIFKKNKSYLVLLYPSILCFVLNKQMLNRADVGHRMPVFIYLSLQFGFLIYHFAKHQWVSSFFTKKEILIQKIKNIAVFKMIAKCTIVVLTLLLLYNMKYPITKIQQRLDRFSFEYYEDFNDFPLITLDKERVQVVKYMRQHSSKNDYIYVGVTNHDRFLFNDVSLYFLMERKIPTRYSELHPGIATTRAVQQEIINELYKTKTKYVVLSHSIWDETNDTKIDSKAEILDQYIQNNYKLIFQNKMYQVLMRK